MAEAEASFTVNSTADIVDASPAWYADGTQIAFQSDRTDGIFNVFVMNAGGFEPGS